MTFLQDENKTLNTHAEKLAQKVRDYRVKLAQTPLRTGDTNASATPSVTAESTPILKKSGGKGLGALEEVTEEIDEEEMERDVEMEVEKVVKKPTTTKVTKVSSPFFTPQIFGVQGYWCLA